MDPKSRLKQINNLLDQAYDIVKREQYLFSRDEDDQIFYRIQALKEHITETYRKHEQSSDIK